MRIGISEWNQRYEVNAKGGEWQDGCAKRKGPLLYIRLKVHGKDQGLGWRRLLSIAGKGKALIVWGLFCKLLEIAADGDSENRNDIDIDADGGLAFILGVSQQQIGYSLEVLRQLKWIEVLHNSGNSGKFRETPGIPANQSINQYKPIQTNTINPPIVPPTGGNGACEDPFSRFWSAYPKKKAKDAAMKAFAKRKPSEALLANMLLAIEAQKRTDDWKRENGRYIPHPATWLNGGCWEDHADEKANHLGEIVQKCYECGRQRYESQMQRREPIGWVCKGGCR